MAQSCTHNACIGGGDLHCVPLFESGDSLVILRSSTDTTVHAIAPLGVPAPDLAVEDGVRNGVRVRRFRPTADTPPRGEELPATMVDQAVAVMGLPAAGVMTAVALTEVGHRVQGVDLCRERLARIASGRADLAGDQLARLKMALADPDLRFTPEPRHIAEADVVFICIEASVDAHMLPDLAPLATACADVVRLARAGQLLVLASAAYPGATADLLVRPLQELGFVVGSDINVAFSAKRLQGGGARVVGGATPACRDRAARLLSRIAPALTCVSGLEVAELARLVESSSRAVHAGLVSEFSTACRELGVAPHEVLDAAELPSAVDAAQQHAVKDDPYLLTWQLRRHHVRLPLVESAMHGMEAPQPAPE